MTSFRILSEASEELEACVYFYNSVRSGLGTRFLIEFERTTSRIRSQPNAGRPVDKHIRSKPVHRFPFYVLYRTTPEEITVIAVAHRRRRPRYWMDRS